MNKVLQNEFEWLNEVMKIKAKLVYKERQSPVGSHYRHTGASRLEFYTANEDVIPENVMSKLTHGPLTSKPRFQVWH